MIYKKDEKMKDIHKKIIVTIAIIAVFSIAGFAAWKTAEWISNDGWPDAGGPDECRNYVEGIFVNVSMEIVDFSEEIADDGSIYYEKNNITYHCAEKKVALTIINNQSTYSDIWLLFYNPDPEEHGYGRYGLHDNLETGTISIFCSHPWYTFAFYGCGYSEQRHKEDWNWIDGNGCYNNNRLFIDRFSPGSIVVIPITFYIDRSYPGTFQDGQYYTSNAFWLMREYPDYSTCQIQKMPFEVRT